jgi:hypothetical protein
MRYFIVFFIAILIMSNTIYQVHKLPDDVTAAYNKLPKTIDYNIHVKPILSDKCFSCHGPDKAKQEAGLRLDISANSYAALPENPSKVAIKPGNLEKSELYHRILSNDPTYVMPTPKSHLTLSAYEKAVLIKWIENGAEYKPHWAFVKPKSIEQLKQSNPNEQKLSIDYFIKKKLVEENLSFSKQANKEHLLRRLSFDIIGLPPSIAELDNYLSDDGPDAYEKQVNRLLASPHYGERMAVTWLDLARFADSHGYTVDRVRDMSPYRDWVINAYNNNMKYDEFIFHQLAGDLMPNPSKDMLIATAFNRNHQQNMEGGIVEEEFQAEYVMDRVNTMGDAILGMSFGCARCHDHKFDPITQKNYYELYSFFSNVREAGQISWNDDLPTPTLMLPTKERQEVVDYINSLINNEEQKIASSTTLTTNTFNQWLAKEEYKVITNTFPIALGLQGYYTFEDSIRNSVDQSEGVMKRDNANSGDLPNFIQYQNGKALSLDGDVYLDLTPIGRFRRSEAFTIGLKVFIPEDLKEGVILHKSHTERLYNFKGFNLYLRDNKLELMMAHTAPSNAITKITSQNIRKNQWQHLTITYDGSSKADGFKLYIDGKEPAMTTVVDQLYKDIIFFKNEGNLGLQIGAWSRGLGLKGGKVDDVFIYNRVITSLEIKSFANQFDFKRLHQKLVSELNTDEKSFLQEIYSTAIDTNILKLKSNIQSFRTQLADTMENIPEIMIMQEMATPKKNHILLRGQYDAPGEEVFPNTPSAILSYDNSLPKNRLGLAKWLTDKDNPLTARIAVNRMWQTYFGVGLVKTSEDFGNQGELPSHPELLDWLANEFIDSGWNVRHIMKLIAMSETYRQDSKVSLTMREKDPENRFLARGPATRLSAEMMRDNVLSASGLINTSIGGKSIKPYQPDGIWEVNNAKYIGDSSEAIYKRSLYILTKRSVPNPTLSTFDAPSRSYCVVRRQQTNTPLQALVTLNDPTYIEACKVIGQTMTKEDNISKAIINTYRKLTGIKPSDKEVNLLTNLHEQSYQNFKAKPDLIKGWLNTGLYKLNDTIEQPLIAAYAIVASTILNSDASITKR